MIDRKTDRKTDPNPKVSILIPTRERPDTLVSCLRTVVDQNYDNLEIIVSDNASGPATEEVVRSFASPRIRYVNTGRRISMSHNFEFALSHVTGDYVTAIGDDDGLIPGGVARAVAAMQAHGAQALGSFTSYYSWPSRGGHRGAVMSVPLGKRAVFKDAREAIRLCLDYRLSYIELPQLYAGGLISMKVIDKVKAAAGGVFYRSQIPDCYSAFAVCSVIDKYLFLEEPWTIAGSSKHSNGGNLLRLQATPFLSEGNIPFHPDIPLPEIGTLTFSIPALVYESYLQTRFLHHDFARITPAHQLEVILCETPVGKDILRDWGKAFAARHGLDYDAIAARARRRPMRRRLALGWMDVINVVDRYRIDANMGLEVADVYQASLVAATVLATRPSRLGGMRRLAARRLRPGAATA